MNSLLLRIYSGIHSGACIELTPGTWVIGSDDSCDIILSDIPGSRHAALTVNDNAQASYEALDGELSSATGEALPSKTLSAGTFYRIGSVLFACGPADAEAGYWLELEKSLMSLLNPEVRAEEAAAQAEEAGQQAEAQPEAPAEEAAAGEDEAEAEAAPEAPRSRGLARAAAAAAVALALAGGWSFGLLNDSARMAYYNSLRNELNALPEVD
ncbi:MAG: hypothetical protein HUK26_09385, partial [Duodenibacillus sp.]|nr:hypothetical protein [Duodenibacillus sp.]